jgi:hypothetical protein
MEYKGIIGDPMMMNSFTHYDQIKFEVFSSRDLFMEEDGKGQMFPLSVFNTRVEALSKINTDNIELVTDIILNKYNLFLHDIYSEIKDLIPKTTEVYCALIKYTLYCEHFLYQIHQYTLQDGIKTIYDEESQILYILHNRGFLSIFQGITSSSIVDEILDESQVLQRLNRDFSDVIANSQSIFLLNMEMIAESIEKEQKGTYGLIHNYSVEDAIRRFIIPDITKNNWQLVWMLRIYDIKVILSLFGDIVENELSENGVEELTKKIITEDDLDVQKIYKILIWMMADIYASAHNYTPTILNQLVSQEPEIIFQLNIPEDYLEIKDGISKIIEDDTLLSFLKDDICFLKYAMKSDKLCEFAYHVVSLYSEHEEDLE